MATQRKCWELLTTEVILVDQKWHRAIITGQSKAERALQAWFCAILSRRKKEEKEEKEGKRSVGGDSLDQFYRADKRRLPMSYNWESKLSRHRPIRKFKVPF